MQQLSPQMQQDWIELLSEDELNDQQREILFLNLDQTDHGWKACAMALLESRALGHTLNDLNNDTIQPVNSLKNPPSSESSKIRSKPATPWFALLLAASLLLVIGFFAGLRMTPTVPNQVSQLLVPETTNVSHPIWKQLVDEDPALVAQFDWNAAGIADGRVIAFVGTTEDDRSILYPIIESPELTSQLVEVEPPRLPPKAARDLARQGWRVKSQKQLVAIEQKDGTRTTYPIGMLNYQFIGRETF